MEKGIPIDIPGAEGKILSCFLYHLSLGAFLHCWYNYLNRDHCHGASFYIWTNSKKKVHSWMSVIHGYSLDRNKAADLSAAVT